MVEIIKNKELSRLNTFHISAKAACYAEFEMVDELRYILEHAQQWYVLGSGSNILLCGNYTGTIIHPVSQKIEVLESCNDRIRVKAAAGIEWDQFVGFCIEKGYAGVENLSAIPGSVGASPVQNIGAYGVEVKDIIESVEYYDTKEGKVVSIANSECGFAYRDSIFKRELKGGAIVISVTYSLARSPQFKLDYGDLRKMVEQSGGATLKSVAKAVRQIRDSKLPNPAVIGNSGSFFKNPVVKESLAAKIREQFPEMPSYPAGENKVKLAAGWLIEKAGWKGFRQGDAGVHDRQALVLVNHGKASGIEILALAKRITEDIKNRFGVEIEPEVNVL